MANFSQIIVIALSAHCVPGTVQVVHVRYLYNALNTIREDLEF